MSKKPKKSILYSISVALITEIGIMLLLIAICSLLTEHDILKYDNMNIHIILCVFLCVMLVHAMLLRRWGRGEARNMLISALPLGSILLICHLILAEEKACYINGFLYFSAAIFAGGLSAFVHIRQNNGRKKRAKR